MADDELSGGARRNFIRIRASFVDSINFVRLSFSSILAMRERGGEKKRENAESGAILRSLTWRKKKKRDERGRAGKWMIVVAFCRESGLLGYRIAENGFDFIFDKGLIFLDGRGGRGEVDTFQFNFCTTHTAAGKSFTSISACKNFLAASPTIRFRAVERKGNGTIRARAAKK